MSGLLDNLTLGFQVAGTPINLLFCFFGALLGTLVGVLPGIGPLATIAMLLPMTYYVDPVTALVMLAGIYYGAQYGGSTTAILLNLPGESSSVVTCIDGYKMARKGRAGSALAIAAIGSFFAGTVATLLIALFSPSLTSLAMQFRPADYTALMVFGIVSSIVLARGSALKAVGMVLLGLLLGLVGMDVNSGIPRFDFGVLELMDGIDFVGVAMGLFGIGEIITNLEKKPGEQASVSQIGRLMPSRKELGQSVGPILRGTTIGSILGILPGGGALLSSFAAYMVEKRISKSPERFGNGAIEGVAAPESANNAGAQTSFIPLLTLGIPSNALIALMAGAMMIHGITPGPQVMTAQPGLFWGLIASMWIGNLMLVIINLPMIGIWVSLLRIPYRLLYLGVLLLCCIGAYGVSNSTFDIYVVAAFAAIGYLFIKLGFEPAPLVIGYILGPLMEENLRRALLLSRGDWTVFVQRPISLSFLALAIGLFVLVALPHIRSKREVVFVGD
ncbi:tripartite tricarboxylate transporter permease [Pseudomonas sp. 21LCFQ02]|uniref:tripartite tricarboxylate transporter permease n=1 Tax=Pseudomonas sp. 21LCFQ02 TaxID=2957505 RepID=UPI00209AFA2B|nr:tripartite tricarboxylate transporter permease [Pseudomonas sp. 21LCFQ02]MCO8167502.1 tripartite tricarboxylate transporter permease [Pseudomonas sp. 21LCFQ02]